MKIRKCNQQILCTLLLILLLSACASPFANIGKTVHKQFSVSPWSTESRSGVWESDNALINYTTFEEGSTFSLSATMTIKDNVLMSFPAAESLRVFINYLDKNGKVISTSEISPNVGYRRVVPENLTLLNIPAAPPEATAFTFSYWGIFIATMTTDGNVADWEIYFNPFVENMEEPTAFY